MESENILKYWYQFFFVIISDNPFASIQCINRILFKLNRLLLKP